MPPIDGTYLSEWTGSYQVSGPGGFCVVPTLEAGAIFLQICIHEATTAMNDQGFALGVMPDGTPLVMTPSTDGLDVGEAAEVH